MAITKSTNFSPELVKDVFSKVKGHSSLAKLSQQEAVPFTGTEIITLSMSGEVAIVAEGGAKPAGNASAAPKTMVPIKVIYQDRVSDEFLRCSDEKQLDFLEQFNDGLAKKMARGIDIMAIHGVDPKTGNAAQAIGTNCFDSQITGTAIISYDDDTPDDCIDAAVAVVEGKEYDVTGVCVAPAVRGDLAKMSTSNGRKYPEFAFGGRPNTLGAMTFDANSTVSFGQSAMRAIVGDFENAFRWGLCEDIKLEVIEYGNPDNDSDAGDLKGHNQVMLRAEAYVAWCILDADAFASVEAPSA